MSDRDLESLEPLSGDALALLGAERRRTSAPSEVSDRVFEHLRTSIAAGAVGVAAAAALAPGVTAGKGVLAGLTARAVPWVLGAALVGGGVGAGIHARLASTPMPPRAATEPTASVAPPSPPTPSPPVAPPLAIASASPPLSAPRVARSETSAGARPPDKDVDLAAERALIEQARMALARGQGAGALAALESHARQFPRGRLAEEREALSVQALVQAGRTDEARARAAAFRVRFPTSVFVPAVNAAVTEAP